MRIGRVDFGGIIKEVDLAFVPEANIGDYVVVHVGYALAKIDPDEARRTLALLAEASVSWETAS
jgi:hydrogenase expression/formation protein HypC